MNVGFSRLDYANEHQRSMSVVREYSQRALKRFLREIVLNVFDEKLFTEPVDKKASIKKPFYKTDVKANYVWIA